MSRLHALSATLAEVGGHFAAGADPALVVPDETIEGRTGIVVVARGGRRFVRSMTWGFPRPAVAGRAGGPDARVGMVADLTNPMWDALVRDPRYRCIILLTDFANPDGERGARTRTWFSVADQPVMAWGGFCRNVEGMPCYAGMTLEANAAVRPTNDRLPVLLEDDEWEAWLGGSIREVIGFQFRAPMAADRVVVWRTDEPWRGGGGPSRGASRLALL